MQRAKVTINTYVCVYIQYIFTNFYTGNKKKNHNFADNHLFIFSDRFNVNFISSS